LEGAFEILRDMALADLAHASSTPPSPFCVKDFLTSEESVTIPIEFGSDQRSEDRLLAVCWLGGLPVPTKPLDNQNPKEITLACFGRRRRQMVKFYLNSGRYHI
jgi:hypothetical protein